MLIQLHTVNNFANQSACSRSEDACLSAFQHRPELMVRSRSAFLSIPNEQFTSHPSELGMT